MSPTLAFAIVGVILEGLGLAVLLGRSRTDALNVYSQRGIDRVENWQVAIEDLVEEQRRNQIKSAFLIILGILLQTFPEYFFG